MAYRTTIGFFHFVDGIVTNSASDGSYSYHLTHSSVLSPGYVVLLGVRWASAAKENFEYLRIYYLQHEW